MSSGDDLLKGAQVIPLSMWGGVPAWLGDETMSRPATNGLFIHHTVTKPTADPCADARTVQHDLHARGLTGYSWLVHQSGVILALNETRIGQHTTGHNSTSFGIAAMLDDPAIPVAPAVLEAVTKGISQMALVLKRFGWLNAKSPVRPHSAVEATACPGVLNPAAIEIVRAVLAQDS